MSDLLPDLHLVLTCRACGADCRCVTAGESQESGLRLGALVDCTECHRRYVVSVQMHDAGTLHGPFRSGSYR